MAVAFSLFLSLLCFLQLAVRTHAAALTTAIGANERVCFYADADKAGEKIGVRSCVRLLSTPLLMLASSSTTLCVFVALEALPLLKARHIGSIRWLV